MQAGFRGPERDAQRRGDIRQLEADVEMQDHERATVGSQSAKRRVQRLPLGDLALELARVAQLLGRQLDLRLASTLSSNEAKARANGQAMDPGVEAVGVTQARQVAPGRDERFLDRIPGQLGIPEDQPGCPAKSADHGGGERGEGVMIAPLRALHE